MHQFLRTGARLLAAPALTTTLVVAGVAGLVSGPTAAPPPADPGTAPAAVADEAAAGVQLGPATKFVREDDGTVRRLR
jgi:hypothetical protein